MKNLESKYTTEIAQIRNIIDGNRELAQLIANDCIDLSGVLPVNEYPNFIIKSISEHYQITEDILISKIRKEEIVEARHLAAYFIRKNTKLKLIDIAYKLGYKNHSMILHAIKAVNNLLDTDKEFYKRFKAIKYKLSMSYNI